METLQQGSFAPPINALTQAGTPFSLADYAGKKVALYFYPEDDTPTCTTQACNLRDGYAALQARGVQVVGVSPNDVPSHDAFTAKYKLPFTLLADPDKKILMDYGVWGEKNLYGKKYMGVRRMTFLINEAGIIEHIIKRADSKNHSQQILKVWGLLTGSV